MLKSEAQQGVAAFFKTDTSEKPASEMTKRDHLAAMCLQGILANKNTTKTTMWSTAQSAVMYADQLIIALQSDVERGVPLVQPAAFPNIPAPVARATT